MAHPANDRDLWIVDAAARLDDHADETAVYDDLQPRLRATVRRGVPVATDDPGIEINTRALRMVLARTIWEICDREIAALEFNTDHKVLIGLRVDLIGRYDDRLGVLGDLAREAIRVKLHDVVGSGTGEDIAIELRWTDLEE